MHIETKTLIYLVSVFGLLVVPRALQRFRLPAPLTCFALGIIVAVFLPWAKGGQVIAVVATLGIASLFLFAGLDVNLVEIRRQLPRLTVHLGFRILSIVALAWLAIRYAHMPWQAASLLALGLLTPSTGFILDTLPQSGLEQAEQTEVALNSIAGEIVAVLLLFVVSQAGSMQTLLVCSSILLLMIVLIPLLFLAFGKYVVPYAPGSEFSLLLMVGIICAVITKNLGIHYLVGAFVTGLIAGLLSKRMTTLVSQENLQAVRLFASFFIPFYFYHEGLDVPAAALVWRSLLYGFAAAAVLLPLRIAKNWIQAKFISRRSTRGGFRVAIALTPTLIFTLVIAAMLRESFHVADTLYGGLLVYAAITTVLPSLVLPGLAEKSIDVMPGDEEIQAEAQAKA